MTIFSKNSLSGLLNFLFSRLLIFTLGISFGSSYNSLLLYIFLSLGREVALKSSVCLCMFACLCVHRCTCIYVHVDVEAGRQFRWLSWSLFTVVLGQGLLLSLELTLARACCGLACVPYQPRVRAFAALWRNADHGSLHLHMSLYPLSHFPNPRTNFIKVNFMVCTVGRFAVYRRGFCLSPTPSAQLYR